VNDPLSEQQHPQELSCLRFSCTTVQESVSTKNNGLWPIHTIPHPFWTLFLSTVPPILPPCVVSPPLCVVSWLLVPHWLVMWHACSQSMLSIRVAIGAIWPCFRSGGLMSVSWAYLMVLDAMCCGWTPGGFLLECKAPGMTILSQYWLVKIPGRILPESWCSWCSW